MVHHVRPQHLYSCDGTCTSGYLCIIPLILVAFHICYLLDHASIYEISALITRFHCTLYVTYIFIQYEYLITLALMTYVYYAYSWPLYYYVSRTAMYTSYLQSYVEIYHCIIQMSGWIFNLVLHYSSPRNLIMYFSHHVPL